MGSSNFPTSGIRLKVSLTPLRRAFGLIETALPTPPTAFLRAIFYFGVLRSNMKRDGIKRKEIRRAEFNSTQLDRFGGRCAELRRMQFSWVGLNRIQLSSTNHVDHIV